MHRNHVWSYDFLTERTEDGRQLRILVVIDEFTRECLAIEVGRSFTARNVIMTLQYQGKPGQWHFGNGLPADGRLVSCAIGRFGRPDAVRQNAAYYPAVAFFSRRRRPRPSLPFPGLRRLVSDAGQRLWMSIGGSSSGEG